MKIVKIFSVNEQVEHVIALTTDLETHLHPVKGCCLKELGGFERSEQISEKDKNIFKLHILRSNQVFLNKNYMHSILQATMQYLFIFIILTFFNITRGNRPQNYLLLCLLWCSYSF